MRILFVNAVGPTDISEVETGTVHQLYTTKGLHTDPDGMSLASKNGRQGGLSNHVSPPGTRDASGATIVQLDGGQQHELDPMTLPPAFVATGWRTGAQVRVVFQRYWAGGPHCLDAGAPVTANCFQGVIRVERAPEE